MKHYHNNNGIGLILVLGLAALPAGAQNQAPSNSPNSSAGTSLGDYARQVRKDPAAKSKPKVFDNDNLPKDDKLSIVGATPEPRRRTTPRQSRENPRIIPPQAKQRRGLTPNQRARRNRAPTPTQPPPLKERTKPAEMTAAKQAAWKQWGEKINSQKQQVDLLTRELDVVQREYQIRAAAMYADAGNQTA